MEYGIRGLSGLWGRPGHDVIIFTSIQLAQTLFAGYRVGL